MSIDPLTIKTLLNDRGTSVTFRRVTEGGYDPSTGQTGAASTDDETVYVAFTDYRENLIDGQNVLQGDRKALLSNYQTDGTALTKTPAVGDEFVGEGSTVQVVEAHTIKDAGQVVGYICQVRGP